MTPAEAELARDYLALPGAPPFTVIGTFIGAGPPSVRDDAGILWRWVEYGFEQWVPDLADAGTGGAMLARFGPEVGVMMTRVCSSAGSPPVYYVDLDIGAAAYNGEGATLGEAVARAAVAAGRAA